MKNIFHPSVIIFGLIFLLFMITVSFKTLDYFYPENGPANKQSLYRSK
jgi:hypothetical protein